MSIYKGDSLIAGGRQCMPLLSFMWADHQLNHPSWLNSTTFSWQSGAVYQAAYQHLADDITGKTLQSETISGTTIQFYLADDGHKICPASEESNVAAIYTATGVAWYYILDTANQRFKLPRTKFGVTGLRDTVGKYVAAGLPNITGSFRGKNAFNDRPALYTGAFGVVSASSVSGASGAGSSPYYFDFDASRSSSIYGNSSTVQPPATQMYLYFYVGNFTQTALENTAGLNAELFNDKVDVGHQVVAYQAPNAGNNYTWYRKYADGWVEQGGRVQLNGVISATNKRITFPVVMANTQYTAGINNNANVGTIAFVGWEGTTGMSVGVVSGSSTGWTSWQVSGIAAN